jgi:hypothetical protein
MERRKFILGVGAAAAAGGTLVGSGAFTSVEADRDVKVQVVGDSDAFLRLAPAENANGDPTPNAQYAEQRDGLLTLDFTSTDAGGSGFNPESVTGVAEVFEIQNQGTQSVEITLRTGEEDDSDTNGAVLAPDIQDAPSGQDVVLVITAHDPPASDPLGPIELGVGEKHLFSASAAVSSSVSNVPSNLETDVLTIQAEAI